MRSVVVVIHGIRVVAMPLTVMDVTAPVVLNSFFVQSAKFRNMLEEILVVVFDPESMIATVIFLDGNLTNLGTTEFLRSIVGSEYAFQGHPTVPRENGSTKPNGQTKTILKSFAFYQKHCKALKIPKHGE